MLGCLKVPSHMTKMASRPIYGKILQKLLLRNPRFGTKRLITLKLGIRHRIIMYYQICSNDDIGLTLSIFMTRPKLFLNASVWVKVYTAYSHVFPSLFSIYYALR